MHKFSAWKLHYLVTLLLFKCGTQIFNVNLDIFEPSIAQKRKERKERRRKETNIFNTNCLLFCLLSSTHSLME